DAIVLDRLPQQSRFIGEKFEQEASRAGFALVIFSDDDFVVRDDEAYGQMRPNTLIELGWFWGRLGRAKIHIIERGQGKMPSDLVGIGTTRMGKDQPVEEMSAQI